MGLIDDIKNIQPLSKHKWTLKELLKIEKKLLKKGQKSLLKELMKNDNIEFTNKDKPVIVDFNRIGNYYKNKN